ncbi:hypothetical protein [Nonomuraea basaltis]|uniref:hypothetical protein n=1 Tax=Nonomuraea basaltis TaxID=2495887 RepID=UPI00110C4718|nr:hypothetical protein [Nonomuraea basaltis]TMR90104.1 hypothetical protein EJK15_57205 [Nonomuraea basaltis]
MVANVAEVFLARQGDDGPIGVDYLEKIQSATLVAVYRGDAAPPSRCGDGGCWRSFPPTCFPWPLERAPAS